MTESEDIAARRKDLLEAGYCAPMATALAEQGQSAMTAASLSQYEALDLFLTWEGIIGYTSLIVLAVDNVRTLHKR